MRPALAFPVQFSPFARAQVGRILATAPNTGRTAADVKQFIDYRPVIEAFINAGGTTNGVAGLP